MKIEHTYRSYLYRGGITSCNWRFTIEHNGVLYTGDIQYTFGWKGDGSDGWFIGYLRSPYIERTYKNTYIVFGYSDVRNNVKYILKAMKEVINGDFSNVKGVGNYVCDISGLKSNR